MIEGDTRSRLNIIISFEYPGVSRDHFYTIEETPARIRADFSQEVTEAEKPYRDLMARMGSSRVDPISIRQKMPTINIIIDYTSPEGDTKRVFVAYDTISYYKEPERRRQLEAQGLTPLGAALRDPFRPFREGFEIRINLDEVKGSTTPLYANLTAKTMDKPAASCDLTLTLPYWDGLYNSRYNPPPG